MAKDGESVDRQGIRLFGALSASISHEIKNVLAILNENAGLLEDLVLMAEKGMPFNAERFRSMAGSMKKQINRGDVIARNMNRFAHSVDEIYGAVQLGETTELIVALSRRFADMKGVRLDFSPPGTGLEVWTRPFELEILLWHCLRAAMDNADENKCVSVDIGENGNKAMIRFSGMAGGASYPANFPAGPQNDVLATLQSELDVNRERGTIVLTLPKNLNMDEGVF